MSLSRKIAAAVAEHVGSASPAPVIAEDGPHRLSLALAHAGRAGVEVEQLDFHAQSADRPERSLDDLKDWAGRLAARLSYLMEPLVVLEADAVAGEVVLRSQAPRARDGRRLYYEARLGAAGTLRLQRIAFDEADRRRRPVPFQLTVEALERLADDLAATAG